MNVDAPFWIQNNLIYGCPLKVKWSGLKGTSYFTLRQNEKCLKRGGTNGLPFLQALKVRKRFCVPALPPKICQIYVKMGSSNFGAIFEFAYIAQCLIIGF